MRRLAILLSVAFLVSGLAIGPASALRAMAGKQDATKRKVSDKYKEVLKEIEAMKKAKEPSHSTGGLTNGGLVNGAELPAKGYGYKIGDPGRKTHFGTDEMVYGLMILGAELEETYGDPGAFYVGDIGGKEGGKLSPHMNHQNGRDVDLGYFICDDNGHPQGNRMLKCDKDGHSKEGTLRFDLERNWTYLCLMCDNPCFGDNIGFILIAEWLRKLILDYGKDKLAKSKSPAERDYLEKHVRLVEKALHVKNDHDNHFHLHIKPSREDMKHGGHD